MLARRASDSYIVPMLIQKLARWLSLRDYDRAKNDATESIIRRQTRGNVSAQNGWYITPGKLVSLSQQADKDMESLRKHERAFSSKNTKSKPPPEAQEAS